MASSSTTRMLAGGTVCWAGNPERSNKTPRKSIPEATVRRRFHDSRLNLIRLLPRLTELRVYDNSAEADPRAGVAPEPRLLLHVARGRIVAAGPLGDTPAWAKPILAAAMNISSA